jgi:hypothetical protein
MRDGYYFIAAGMSQVEPNEVSLISDLTIESMSWLDDSLLIITTSSDELRVLYTEKFMVRDFREPEYL